MLSVLLSLDHTRVCGNRMSRGKQSTQFKWVRALQFYSRNSTHNLLIPIPLSLKGNKHGDCLMCCNVPSLLRSLYFSAFSPAAHTDTQTGIIDQYLFTRASAKSKSHMQRWAFIISAIPHVIYCLRPKLQPPCKVDIKQQLVPDAFRLCESQRGLKSLGIERFAPRHMALYRRSISA